MSRILQLWQREPLFSFAVGCFCGTIATMAVLITLMLIGDLR